MTVKALSTFHSSVVDNSQLSTRVLLKLVHTGGKPTLIAVHEPDNYFNKIFYFVDLFINKQDYKLSTIANYLKSQKFTAPLTNKYLESVNKKIEKHNDKHPHDAIETIQIQTIAKKRLAKPPSTHALRDRAAAAKKPIPKKPPAETSADPLQAPVAADASRADSEDLRISHALEISEESKDEELAKIAGMPITRLTMQRMKDGALLNDELINAYMELINERSTAKSHLPKVYCMNTFFLEKLLPGGSYCYDNVKRWLKNIDLLSYDLIMVPVHVHTNHWSLAVINIKEERLEYYDSLQIGDTRDSLEHLGRWLKDRANGSGSKPELDPNSWTKHVHKDIPLQSNAIDCGVFTCQYANSLALGSKCTFRQSQIPAIRRHMVREFLDRILH